MESNKIGASESLIRRRVTLCSDHAQDGVVSQRRRPQCRGGIVEASRGKIREQRELPHLADILAVRGVAEHELEQVLHGVVEPPSPLQSSPRARHAHHQAQGAVVGRGLGGEGLQGVLFGHRAPHRVGLRGMRIISW